MKHVDNGDAAVKRVRNGVAIVKLESYGHAAVEHVDNGDAALSHIGDRGVALKHISYDLAAVTYEVNGFINSSCFETCRLWRCISETCRYLKLYSSEICIRCSFFSIGLDKGQMTQNLT